MRLFVLAWMETIECWRVFDLFEHDLLDKCSTWPVAGPVDHFRQGDLIASNGSLDITVAAISYPAGDLQATGYYRHVITKADALNNAGNNQMAGVTAVHAYRSSAPLLDLHSRRGPAVGRKNIQPAGLALRIGSGKHHSLRHAKFHLARRQVGDHDG